MTKLTTASVLACSLALACGSDSTSQPDAAPNPFAGKWSCSRQETITFAAPPELAVFGTLDNVERSTVEVTPQGDELTLFEKTETGSICDMSFTSNGTKAVLKSARHCMLGTLRLTLKSGSAKVGAYEMRLDVGYDAEGPVSIQASVFTAVAVGTQIGTCHRLAADAGAANQR